MRIAWNPCLSDLPGPANGGADPGYFSRPKTLFHVFQACFTCDEPSPLMQLRFDLEQGPEGDWLAYAEQALQAAAPVVAAPNDQGLEASHPLTSDAAGIHRPNRELRQRGTPANVPSFPTPTSLASGAPILDGR